MSPTSKPKRPVSGIVVIAHPSAGGPSDSPRLTSPEDESAEPNDNPAEEQTEGEGEVRPEWVNFRKTGESCHSCSMDSAGTCTLLNIPIGESCNAFSPHGGYGASNDHPSEFPASIR